MRPPRSSQGLKKRSRSPLEPKNVGTAAEDLVVQSKSACISGAGMKVVLEHPNKFLLHPSLQYELQPRSLFSSAGSWMASHGQPTFVEAVRRLHRVPGHCG